MNKRIKRTISVHTVVTTFSLLVLALSGCRTPVIDYKTTLTSISTPDGRTLQLQDSKCKDEYSSGRPILEYFQEKNGLVSTQLFDFSYNEGCFIDNKYKMYFHVREGDGQIAFKIVNMTPNKATIKAEDIVITYPDGKRYDAHLTLPRHEPLDEIFIQPNDFIEGNIFPTGTGLGVYNSNINVKFPIYLSVRNGFHDQFLNKPNTTNSIKVFLPITSEHDTLGYELVFTFTGE